MQSEDARLISFQRHDAHAAALEAVERDAWTDLYRAADRRTAEALQMAHAMRSGFALTAMRGINFGLFNRAQGLGCGGALDEFDVEGAMAWLRAHCAPDWRLQLVPSSCALNFPKRAADIGLVPKGRGPAKLYRFSDSVLAKPFEGRSDLDIRPVTAATARACVDTVRITYGMPPSVTDWGITLVERPGWYAYAAFDGDVPVAFGLMFVRGEEAGLGWGTTLPSDRGRGAQSGLLRRRIDDGEALGVRRFVTECEAPSGRRSSASTSYRNIVRAGFVEAYVRTTYGPA